MNTPVLLLIPGMSNTPAVWAPTRAHLGEGDGLEVRVTDVRLASDIPAMARAGWQALVLQQLLACLAACGASGWCSGFRPGRPGPLGEVAALLKFGGCSGLANVINYFQSNLGTIIVGHFFGAAAAGFAQPLLKHSAIRP